MMKNVEFLQDGPRDSDEEEEEEEEKVSSRKRAVAKKSTKKAVVSGSKSKAKNSPAKVHDNYIVCSSISSYNQLYTLPYIPLIRRDLSSVLSIESIKRQFIWLCPIVVGSLVNSRHFCVSPHRRHQEHMGVYQRAQSAGPGR
jgi:hypothetical protein